MVKFFYTDIKGTDLSVLIREEVLLEEKITQVNLYCVGVCKEKFDYSTVYVHCKPLLL